MPWSSFWLFQFNHLNRNRLNRWSRQGRTKSNRLFLITSRCLKNQKSPQSQCLLNWSTFQFLSMSLSFFHQIVASVLYNFIKGPIGQYWAGHKKEDTWLSFSVCYILITINQMKIHSPIVITNPLILLRDFSCLRISTFIK